MKSSAIVYQARTDSTPETEIAVLSNVYSFILTSRQAKINAAGMSSTNGGDEKGSKHDLARTIIPDR
jgi:hypothetical protein